MEQKPRIQYVGEFYVRGSAAPAIEHEVRRPRTTLPKIHLEKIEKIYVNPVALSGILFAAIVLIVMVVGAFRLNASWKEYNAVSASLAAAKRENAKLDHTFHTVYDWDEIRAKAVAEAMIPIEEAQTMTIRVTVPSPAKQRTAWDDFKWFMSGLFAEE